MTDQLWSNEAVEAAREAFERALVARLEERDQSIYLSGGGWRAELHVQAGDDDMGPLVDAVLAALAVHAIPKQAVLDLARQWEETHDASFERTDYETCSAELRALAGGDQ